MSNRKKKVVVYLFLLITLVISLRLIRDIQRLLRTDERLIGAEIALEQAKKEQQELKQQLDKAETWPVKEKQIRDILKMTRPEEVIVIVPEEIKPADEVVKLKETEAEPLANWQKWWQVLVD